MVAYAIQVAFGSENMKGKELADYSSTIVEIKGIVRQARQSSYAVVNATMLKAYFEIGEKIVEKEQRGKSRAGYGEGLLEAVSGELVREFGRGFSVTALKNMRKFYRLYKGRIGQSVTDEFFKLSWTHYCELIKIADETKRRYFEKYAESGNLGGGALPPVAMPGGVFNAFAGAIVIKLKEAVAC